MQYTNKVINDRVTIADVASGAQFSGATCRKIDFSNLNLLTVGQLKRAELHRHAKFGQNRTNHGRDMVILRFFQDGGRPPY